MPNYCIVYSYVESKGRYPTDAELDELGKKIPKFKDVCKTCPHRVAEDCTATCDQK